MHVQKIKEEKLTRETYLESVDGLRNDEECRSPVKMNFLELDLGVAMSLSITLQPARSEKHQPISQTNGICKVRNGKESKRS